jgi:DNA-binding transcriptional ArsR family regulator
VSKRSSIQPRAGRFAYDGLDRAFHEKARLGIMTSLSTQPDGLSFSDLKELCSLSDGNLNRHLSVLHEAGLIKIKKQGGGRSSHTMCLVTPSGKRAFLQYLRELERVIADAAASANEAASASQSARVKAPLRAGWSTA